jgi:hypothetical protein
MNSLTIQPPRWTALISIAVRHAVFFGGVAAMGSYYGLGMPLSDAMTFVGMPAACVAGFLMVERSLMRYEAASAAEKARAVHTVVAEVREPIGLAAAAPMASPLSFKRVDADGRLPMPEVLSTIPQLGRTLAQQ